MCVVCVCVYVSHLLRRCTLCRVGLDAYVIDVVWYANNQQLHRHSANIRCKLCNFCASPSLNQSNYNQCGAAWHVTARKKLIMFWLWTTFQVGIPTYRLQNIDWYSNMSHPMGGMFAKVWRAFQSTQYCEDSGQHERDDWLSYVFTKYPRVEMWPWPCLTRYLQQEGDARGFLTYALFLNT